MKAVYLCVLICDSDCCIQWGGPGKITPWN